MSQSEILLRLRELHEKLSGMNDDLEQTEQVDEETIDALGLLVTDISTLVDRAHEKVQEQPDLEDHHQLLDRIMKFETEHPQVTSFLSQVTDVLVLLGI